MWLSDLHVNDIPCTFRNFKSLFEPEQYLSGAPCRRQCVAMTRFRCSNHHLAIESGGWTIVERCERICNIVLKIVMSNKLRMNFICYVFVPYMINYVYIWSDIQTLQIYIIFVIFVDSCQFFIYYAHCFVCNKCRHTEAVFSVKMFSYIDFFLIIAEIIR